ncbi:MAG: hypothetical protein E5X67_18880 [Mesorhizobium sp.]|uniref:hypothetical protein n=1 Tax=Mesorhizobium sp. TaxID=1871066 RepID=UPI0011FC34CF|nr:hypothetical protein [Mesorhizobium sp.]TIP26703.1 MAG: hypothetical protein E5X67_18880 [Mesorhizobium sp.]
MEILLVLIVLGAAAYYFFKGNVRRRAPLTIDDVIDRGRLYQALSKHMETLEVKADAPLGFRMSRFLSFGADIARRAAEIPKSTDEMDPGHESAAVVLVVQQGIHTLMTLEMGSNAVKTSSYKAEWAKVFEFTMWQTFRYDSRDPQDERGQRILELGHRVTKIAQSENAALLQHIFDAWDSILNGLSDESVDQMGNAMREAVDWCKKRLDSTDTHERRDALYQEIVDANKMLNQRMGFDKYLTTVVAEAKRLDGKAAADLHWIELTDDEGTKRAYADGVNPERLAAEILKFGPPPPSRVW